MNKIDFVMTHAPGSGSLVPPVDLQPSMLPLCCGCPQYVYEESTVHKGDWVYKQGDRPYSKVLPRSYEVMDLGISTGFTP